MKPTPKGRLVGGRSPGFWNGDDDEVSIPKLAPEVMVGTFDDHWEVDGEVGQGATSRVYKCVLKTDRLVYAACKVVNKNRLGFGRRKKKKY